MQSKSPQGPDPLPDPQMAMGSLPSAFPLLTFYCLPLSNSSVEEGTFQMAWAAFQKPGEDGREE